jgi:virginiamycin B lyase
MQSLRKKTVLSFLLSVVLLTQVAAVSQFKSFRIPTKNSEPEGITLGPDGNMWFAEATANQIGRIDPTGNITEFVVPQASSAPVDIVAGADGALWFTEESGFPEGIGRVTTSGVFTGSLNL